MKAPDKIYVPIVINMLTKRQLIRLDATDVNPVSFANENLEYIRKDAILEWAKEQKKATEGLIKEHPKDDSLWAEMHWYEQVIKHIESL